MIDRRKVVENETKSALKLLSELPSHGQWCGRVVQDVTNEMQTGELAGHRRAINDERSNDDIGNLQAVSHKKKTKHSLVATNRYLIRCFRVLQTESHTSCEFTAHATQRPKHGFEAFSCQSAEFRLASAFLLRLLSGICREDAIVTLDAHIVNPYVKTRREVSYLVIELRLYNPILLYQ